MNKGFLEFLLLRYFRGGKGRWAYQIVNSIFLLFFPFVNLIIDEIAKVRTSNHALLPLLSLIFYLRKSGTIILLVNHVHWASIVPA